MSSSAKKTKVMIFYENPYDLETLTECLHLARKHNKEIIFLDRLLANIRLDPCGDLTNINYRILHDLNIMKLENTTH